MRDADVLTRVSEYVPKIISFVEDILKKGMAYEALTDNKVGCQPTNAGLSPIQLRSSFWVTHPRIAFGWFAAHLQQDEAGRKKCSVYFDVAAFTKTHAYGKLSPHSVGNIKVGGGCAAEWGWRQDLGSVLSIGLPTMLLAVRACCAEHGLALFVVRCVQLTEDGEGALTTTKEGEKKSGSDFAV